MTTYESELRSDRRARAYAAFAAGEVDPPHGTTSTYYNYGCKCDACRKAIADAQRRRRNGKR